MIKLFRNLIKGENTPYILTIIVLGFAPLLWFGQGYIVAGHDSGLPLEPVVHFLDRLYLWTQRYGMGSNQSFAVGGFFIHGLEALISWLGFSLTNAQKILFVIWFVLPGLSMYYLGRTISSDRSHRPAWLIASVFYMYNHFLLQAWFVAERTKFSMYIALPLVLVLFFKVYEKKINVVKASALLSVLLFFLNGGGFLPLYGALLIGWVTAFAYFLFITPTKDNFKRLTTFSALSFIFSGVINAYWVIPYAYSALYTYNDALETVGGINGVKGWIDTISQNATYDNLLRLQGIQEWYVNQRHPYAQVFLGNPLISLVSFLIPFITYLAVFFAKKDVRKYILFFALFSLVSMIFSAGSQSPFGFFYIFLVEHIPGFAIFRTPFYKFATGIWLCYSILIGFSLNYLIQNYLSYFRKLKIQYLTLGLSLFLIILYSFPFLNGLFFDYEVGYKSTRIKVPDYVFQANNRLNQILSYSDRTLLIPEHNSGINIESYKWGFWSLATLESLMSDRSFVSNNASMVGEEKPILDTLYARIIEKDPSWIKLANLLFINGFLVRDDFDWKQDKFNTHEPKEYEDALTASNQVDKKLEEGEWKYYRLKSGTNDSFYLSQDPVFITGDSSDLDSLISVNEIKDNSVLIFADKINQKLISSKDTLSPKTIINSAHCVRCDLSRSPVFLPGVDWFGTGSILYSLTKQREERKLEGYNRSYERVKFATELTNNRLVSVFATYFQRKTPQERTDALSEYNNQLRRLETVILEPAVGDKEALNNELVISEDYLYSHRDKIEGLFEGASSVDEEAALVTALDTIKDLFVRIRQSGWRTDNEISKKYLINIPVKSDYKILLNSSTTSSVKDLLKKNFIDIDLDGTHSTLSASLRSGSGWIESSPINIDEGVHKLNFNDARGLNLLEPLLPGVPLDANTSREGNNLFKITSEGEEACLRILLPKVSEEGKYEIEFAFKKLQGKQDLAYYISEGQSYRSSLSRNIKDFKISPYLEQYADEVVLRKSETRYLNFCNKLDRKANLTSINQIENISLRKITAPVIAFVNVQNSQGVQSSINSKRVDNTKYEFNISSTGFTYLVFNQRFDTGWVIYPKNPTGNLLQSFLVSLFSKPKTDDRFVPFKANGMLNGWYVPEALQGEFVVEYIPQRVFYRSVLLSVLALIAMITIIIKVKGYGKQS